MKWTRRAAALALAGVLVPAAGVDAGHESPIEPSFYPQEIRLISTGPAEAAGMLPRAALHAYVGPDLYAGRTVPATVTPVTSFGGYVVLTLNAAAPGLGRPEQRCAAAEGVARALAAHPAGFVPHPYPVTPYHGDYLEHADLAQAAVNRIVRPRQGASDAKPALGGRPLRLAARGPLAERLARGAGRLSEGAWDARLETVEVDDLLAGETLRLNGWLGPPWFREGWFQAYLLLGGPGTDRTARAEAGRLALRLTDGSYRNAVERANLARTLVRVLERGCERTVLGYTLRREYVNTEYSAGVQNIAFDAQSGLDSAIFVRTVKLKDFIWNGWLRVGVAGGAAEAWNPVGGMGDPFGRLLWSAVGDPALLPSPYAATWIANRASPETFWSQQLARMLGSGAGGGEIAVPPDALLPEAGTGILRSAGPGRHAGERIQYRLLLSSFHDGTPMSVADLLYAYAFAFRWGGGTPGTPGAGGTRGAYDPLVARATAPLRRALAGIKVLTTQHVVKDLGGDLRLTYEVPVIDVYLGRSAADLQQAAAIAPPWSALPWQVLALMEEGVRRGIAAFSPDAARSAGVPWLDLVRDSRTKARLSRLLDDLAAQAYVPEALRGRVTPAEAARRWRALQAFYRTTGHFLDANGPYRLARWSAGEATLAAYRDLSYSLGVGSFDRWPIPHRAYITDAAVRGGRLEVRLDVERVVKFGRDYRLARERLGSNSAGAIDDVRSAVPFVVVGPDGTVRKIGAAAPAGGDRFQAPLDGALGPGPTTIVVGAFLNDNAMLPDVRVIASRR